MNYEKLYKKLKKILKTDLKYLRTVTLKLDDRFDLVEKINNEGQIAYLEYLFNEYLPELEGNQWNNVFLNKIEFEEWKDKIKK